MECLADQASHLSPTGRTRPLSLPALVSWILIDKSSMLRRGWGAMAGRGRLCPWCGRDHKEALEVLGQPRNGAWRTAKEKRGSGRQVRGRDRGTGRVQRFPCITAKELKDVIGRRRKKPENDCSCADVIEFGASASSSLRWQLRNGAEGRDGIQLQAREQGGAGSTTVWGAWKGDL